MKNRYLFLLIVMVSLLCTDLFSANTMEDADQFCEQGIEYYQQKKYREAAYEWEKALNINPDHKLANYYLIRSTEEKNAIDYLNAEAVIQYEKKEYSGSLKKFSNVLEYDIQNEIAVKYIKRISEKIAGSTKLKNEIIRSYKNDGEQYKGKDDLLSAKKGLAVYRTLVMIAPEDGDARASESHFEKKVPELMKKESVDIYDQIGDEYFKEKKYEEAIIVWRKAMLLDPERIDIEDKIVKAFKLKLEIEKQEKIAVLIKEGESSMQAGLYSSALSLFEEVLKLDPENQKALNNRKKLLQQRQSEEEAKSIEAQIRMYFLLGKKYFSNEEYEKARETFQNILYLNKDHQQAIEYIAKCDEELKKIQKKIQEKDIADIQRTLEEGIVYYQEGEFQKAITSLSACLKLSPGNRFAEEYLTLAKKALWVKQEEEVDIQSPFYQLIHNMIYRGELLFKNKEYEQSMEVWKSILDLFPLNKIARDYIVQCSKYLSPTLFQFFIDEHIQLARKYKEKGEKEYAYKEYSLVKRLFPEYPDIDGLISSVSPEKRPEVSAEVIQELYNKGLVYYREQDYRNAIQTWEKVLTYDPYHQKAILNINKLNHMLNYDSIKEKRQVSRDKEARISKFYYEGLKFYNQNDYKNAIKMWQNVLQLDPGHIKAQNNIKTCRMMMK